MDHFQIGRSYTKNTSLSETQDDLRHRHKYMYTLTWHASKTQTLTQQAVRE